MSRPDTRPGGCLCGAVRFHARPKKAEMDVCHCDMCRRWSGGAWMAVECESDLAIDGEAHLGIFHSSDVAERGFCRTCGTSLFWRLRDGTMLSVSAQTFDEPDDYALTLEIFIDEKPANYAFANDTVKLTGAEVMAKFHELTGGSR